MKREQVKRVGGMLLGAAMLVILTACGGSAGANTVTPPANPQPAAQPAQAAPAPAQPAVSAAPPANPQPASQPAQAAPAAPAPAQPATQPADKATSELLAKGKLIFDKTAGGVGCAHCHGLDGSGKGAAAVGAPDNRGASETKVRAALGGAVPLMSFIKLSDDEITAVVAYLKYLNEQP